MAAVCNAVRAGAGLAAMDRAWSCIVFLLGEIHGMIYSMQSHLIQMPDPVNPRRRYLSRIRSEQAEQTRARVLAVARELFVELGWTKTTIAAIARAAGVSAETIYAVFGSKPAILEHLIRDALRGDSPATPLMEQPEPRAILSSTDRIEQIRRFSRGITAVLLRVAPLVVVVRTASEREAEMRTLYLALHAGRRRQLGLVVEALTRSGPLPGGMSTAEATEHVARLVSPELFLLMRDVEGLDDPAIAAWIEAMLTRLLVERPCASDLM
jgi:AcrR family transcriptional regulator